MKKVYGYIRYSTDEQASGDSVRRQRDAIEEFARESKSELVEVYVDRGVSAYQGLNQAGELGRFIQQVKTGQVTRGSVLVVESIDRLSREGLFKAFGLVTSIVTAGVAIHSLFDRRSYDDESLGDLSSMFQLMLTSSRSNEESRVKAERVAQSWKKKRMQARSSNTLVSRSVPAWIRVDKETGKRTLIRERVRVVREIFRWSRDGFGARSIAVRLNERGESTWWAKKTSRDRPTLGLWHESYIKKILSSRATLGEFQLHRMEKVAGKGMRRVPDGDPIPGYFPAAVDENLFLSANAAVASRRVSGRGRKARNYGNLFAGLARCGACRSAMRFVNKGVPPKGGRYLVCARAQMRGGCKTRPWRYRDFESDFLRFLRNVDLKLVLNGGKRDEAIEGARLEVLRVEDALKSVRAQLDRLTSAIELGISEAPRTIVRRMSDLEAEMASLGAKKLVAEEQLRGLLAAKVDEGELRELLRRVSPAEEARDEETRRSLSAEIRRVVARIDLRAGSYPWEVDEEGVPDEPSQFVVRYHSGETDVVVPQRNARIEIRNPSALLRGTKANS